MKPILEAFNLSKRYYIQEGKTSYRTLRESILSPDFLKKKEDFWALQNVSFKMHKGETMGIIGENGSGKTTLLKVLSKITNPTSGRGVVRGRVISLLEVGTGFHPELTGKENIYLNGVILNLKKKEIDKRFDEIVDFAGACQFIQTPLKHYSTGMWARLAFSVAAHLDPEILFIDEVLSVGDAQFQKKSLAKMNELSKHGRTVIFVSHNMAAVRQLCSKCMLLNNGKIKLIGDPNDVINAYLNKYNRSFNGQIDVSDIKIRNGSQKAKLEKIELRNQRNKITSTFCIKDDLAIHLYFRITESLKNIKIIVQIKDSAGVPVCNIYDSDSGFELQNIKKNMHISLTIRDIRFYPDTYYISVSLSSEILNYKRDCYDEIENVLSFNIVNQVVINRALSKNYGLLLLTPDWQIH